MSTAIGNLRHKIYLIQFQNQVADGYGGYTIGGTATKRTFWGDVEEVGSNRQINLGQQVLNKTYRIIARYSKENKVSNGDYIIYGGKIIVVGGAVNTDKNRFIEITGEERDSGNASSESLPGSLLMYHYTSTGGESELLAEELLNKDVLVVFEEGTALQVVDSEPGRLQAEYVDNVDDDGTMKGKIKFDHALEPDEIIQVMYQ